ncbi:hypothetical protein [Natrarchaeobaculum sulfurireducens]|uniref:Uncharacterized protein n=1 Tax=Natrarchaeobaculum sulfurireducens TaxID=2044521 RepID=A0A346PTR8_9EURY|nr:hypothetical protein [Natrarchaeobaculum sulfurireducens]AXR77121.1 hypothetical protein AArc1_0779 [Natrarchaeobaculum sulfurireducens]AXR82913.1 hypothetical protein AArcMg_2924 [Natrarchaeobaculum sulfurireducens]
MFRRNDLALSLLAVGAAAAAGYVLQSRRQTGGSARSKADVGARLVRWDEVPSSAPVVDATSRRLSEIPGARRAIQRAVRNDAREEWEHVTLERDGAWSIVDAVRDSLPYYDGDDGEYNGVYVRYGDRIVVLDAIGWARLEEPLY